MQIVLELWLTYRAAHDDREEGVDMDQPYFRLKGVKIWLGNCEEVMKVFPPECVDLIFADPPYNLSNGGTTCHAGKRVSVDKGSWDASRGFDEDLDFHQRWIAECRRVLKPNGSVWISGTYHSIYSCGATLQQQGWHVLNDIAWYKPNAAPNLACRMFTASHETLIWARKSKSAKHTFNYEAMKQGSYPGDVLKKPGKQMRSVWSIGTPKRSEKEFGKHPTQKPIALLDRIIAASSNTGDIVLDPFCGSGTTGVSALSQGRRFVGIDNSEEYLADLAIPRLLAATPEITQRT